jgi:hypothetical protein
METSFGRNYSFLTLLCPKLSESEQLHKLYL